MLKKHKDIQLWIKQHYEQSYNVAIEVDRKNYLPDFKRHWYEPDVIIRDDSGNIRYILLKLRMTPKKGISWSFYIGRLLDGST